MSSEKSARKAPGTCPSRAQDVLQTVVVIRPSRLYTLSISLFSRLLLTYLDEKSDVLKLAGTGKGGLAEFTSQLKDDQAAFGYVRMVVGNDELVCFVLAYACLYELAVLIWLVPDSPNVRNLCWLAGADRVSR